MASLPRAHRVGRIPWLAGSPCSRDAERDRSPVATGLPPEERMDLFRPHCWRWRCGSPTDAELSALCARTWVVAGRGAGRGPGSAGCAKVAHTVLMKGGFTARQEGPRAPPSSACERLHPSPPWEERHQRRGGRCFCSVSRAPRVPVEPRCRPPLPDPPLQRSGGKALTVGDSFL